MTGSVTRVPGPDVLIHARGLAKTFGGAVAVAGIDFDLHRGEAFGFLGPNGAGKSSTMRMIGCVSPPGGGELSILGLDPVRDGPAIRARLGVVPQEDTLDLELTVRENLIIYGRYFGLPRQVIAERIEVLADRILLYTRDGDTALAAVRGLGLEPVTSLVRRSTLEDVFLRLTGRRLED